MHQRNIVSDKSNIEEYFFNKRCCILAASAKLISSRYSRTWLSVVTVFPALGNVSFFWRQFSCVCCVKHWAQRLCIWCMLEFGIDIRFNVSHSTCSNVKLSSGRNLRGKYFKNSKNSFCWLLFSIFQYVLQTQCSKETRVRKFSAMNSLGWTLCILLAPKSAFLHWCMV